MSYTLTDHSGAFVSSINSVKEADLSLSPVSLQYTVRVMMRFSFYLYLEYEWVLMVLSR